MTMHDFFLKFYIFHVIKMTNWAVFIRLKKIFCNVYISGRIALLVSITGLGFSTILDLWIPTSLYLRTILNILIIFWSTCVSSAVFLYATNFQQKKSPFVLCLNISLKKNAVIELSKCRTEVRFCYCIYPYLFLNVFKIIEKFPENSRQHTEPILESKSLVILKKKTVHTSLISKIIHKRICLWMFVWDAPPPGPFRW